MEDVSVFGTANIRPTCHLVTMATVATPVQQDKHPVFALMQQERKHTLSILQNEERNACKRLLVSACLVRGLCRRHDHAIVANALSVTNETNLLGTGLFALEVDYKCAMATRKETV